MDSRAQPCRRLRRRELHIKRGQQVDQSNSKISFRCKNILAARSVPLLFILVCFLVIANTRCDQAGGANGEIETIEEAGHSSSSNNGNFETSFDKLKKNDLASLNTKDLEGLEQQAIALKSQHNQKSTARKMDPLNILREIYLDSNSKIITMLMPESETVQKFHPNGRYGRRSVDNFAEPHVELGRLIYNEDQQNESQQAPLTSGAKEVSALRAILRGIGRGPSSFDPHLSAVATSHTRGAPTKYQSASSSSIGPRNLMGSNNAQVANYQLEMNKLLKCNFTGISNLYWCDAASNN